MLKMKQYRRRKRDILRRLGRKLTPLYQRNIEEEANK